MERDAELERRLGAVIAGKYELVRVLGRGGMGAVFEARHQKTDGRYAVKFTRADAGRDESERMLREARALARLDHPNVVRLVDFDEDPLGGVFLVQELVGGRTLRALLDEELTLPPERALGLLMPILDALAYAHARGVVHRDVKPENIVLREGAAGELTPKLIDFGLAREAHTDPSSPERGALVGTPRYMSPEQACGREDVDARSDVWSFGVVLYECLAGVAPHDSPDDREALERIVSRDPPHLRGAAVGVGDALADAVMQALVRAPEARCPSAAALARSLAALPEFEREPQARPSTPRAPTQAPVPPSSRSATPARRVALWIALAALVVAVTAALTRAPGRPRAAAPSADRSSPAPAPGATPSPPPTPPSNSPPIVARSVDASPDRAATAITAPARVNIRRRSRSSDAAVPHGVNSAPIVDEI